MTRRTPRILMSVAAAGMAGGLVVATAAPAVADTADLWGSNARWLSVSSTSPYIGDAESAYRDLLGSGVDLPFGWTGDVFDGALYGWTLSDGASTASITWTAAGEVVDPTGVSTWN